MLGFSKKSQLLEIIISKSVLLMNYAYFDLYRIHDYIKTTTILQ